MKKNQQLNKRFKKKIKNNNNKIKFNQLNKMQKSQLQLLKNRKKL